MLVYLFGKMKDLTQSEAGNWRDRAEIFLRKYQIPVYNPMNHVPVLKENEKIGNYYGSKEEVKTDDMYFLKKADVFLGRLNEPSLGSPFEMGAAYILDKTIIAFDICDEYREHPLTGTSWNLEFETLGKALEYIRKLSLMGE